MIEQRKNAFEVAKSDSFAIGIIVIKIIAMTGTVRTSNNNNNNNNNNKDDQDIF